MNEHPLLTVAQMIRLLEVQEPTAFVMFPNFQDTEIIGSCVVSQIHKTQLTISNVIYPAVLLLGPTNWTK
jgi:hypothetical protein